MKAYGSISLWLVLSFSVLFSLDPAMAASITETRAAIGEGCVASGASSTAMGRFTTASGFISTAMGYNTIASGYNATAMGHLTTAGGDYSFSGGRYMQLAASADQTFVWGYSDTAQPLYAANAFLIFPAGVKGNVGIGTPAPVEKLHIRERATNLGAAVLLDSTGGSGDGSTMWEALYPPISAVRACFRYMTSWRTRPGSILTRTATWASAQQVPITNWKSMGMRLNPAVAAGVSVLMSG